MTDATQGLQHDGPANKFWPGCHSIGASVPVALEVCLHEPGCLLDPNWLASLGRLAKSIVMLLDLLLVCLGPLVANGPLARLIRVDESGQLVLPSSGERVVGWSGFCLPGRVAAAAGL